MFRQLLQCGMLVKRLLDLRTEISILLGDAQKVEYTLFTQIGQLGRFGKHLALITAVKSGLDEHLTFMLHPVMQRSEDNN